MACSSYHRAFVTCVTGHCILILRATKLLPTAACSLCYDMADSWHLLMLLLLNCLGISTCSSCTAASVMHLWSTIFNSATQLAIKAAVLMVVLVLMCLVTCRETDNSVQAAPAKKQKQDTGAPVAVSC